MRILCLFAKSSKCHFGMERIEYLGYFISGKGVETNPAKMSSVVQWPIPHTIRDLRSFLGLVGYYRKFIARYAWLRKPLTQLLKKRSSSFF